MAIDHHLELVRLLESAIILDTEILAPHDLDYSSGCS
jgi:hypothetical protein